MNFNVARQPLDIQICNNNIIIIANQIISNAFIFFHMIWNKCMNAIK